MSVNTFKDDYLNIHNDFFVPGKEEYVFKKYNSENDNYVSTTAIAVIESHIIVGAGIGAGTGATAGAIAGIPGTPLASIGAGVLGGAIGGAGGSAIGFGVGCVVAGSVIRKDFKNWKDQNFLADSFAEILYILEQDPDLEDFLCPVGFGLMWDPWSCTKKIDGKMHTYTFNWPEIQDIFDEEGNGVHPTTRNPISKSDFKSDVRFHKRQYLALKKVVFKHRKYIAREHTELRRCLSLMPKLFAPSQRGKEPFDRSRSDATNRHVRAMISPIPEFDESNFLAIKA